jgi:uncharacterized protein (DUF779 family)
MIVQFTRAALAVVRQVQQAREGASWVFVFGEGCCEGTAPHLFANHHVGATQEEVGRAETVPVYADAHIRQLYGDRSVTIDVEEDPLADGFSAEIELGYRFVMRAGEAGKEAMGR